MHLYDALLRMSQLFLPFFGTPKPAAAAAPRADSVPLLVRDDAHDAGAAPEGRGWPRVMTGSDRRGDDGPTGIFLGNGPRGKT